MTETSVFDIGASLIERSGEGAMSTVKLQKLCFYTFGWYAHLTGESLFSESFYAMEKGPVVGELLSAHAGHARVSRDQLMTQLAERDGFRDDLGAYVERVIGAVWSYYGRFGPWKLVDLTHEEDVWQSAWMARREGTKRADLTHDAVIEHFLWRSTTGEEDLELPHRSVTFAAAGDIERAERESASFHPAFVAAFTSLRAS